jgi:hypothetical protein
LRRGPAEVVNLDLRRFYARLPPRSQGSGKRVEAAGVPAGVNWTSNCFICFAWHGRGQASSILVVNYAPNQSQCYVNIPYDELQCRTMHFRDLMGNAEYDRDGDEVRSRGLSGSACVGLPRIRVINRSGDQLRRRRENGRKGEIKGRKPGVTQGCPKPTFG